MPRLNIATPKRFTLEEYHHLTDLGFFQENSRIELIRGEIIQIAAKGTAHTTCSMNLLQILVPLIAPQALLRCQDPITLSSNSEPEPDFSIVRKRDDNYFSSHPYPQDILLVIEISDSTLSYDKGVKLALYAEAKISDYWIFNLVDNYLEMYSEPYQTNPKNFGYRLKRIVLPQESVSLPHFPNSHLDLSQIFPAFKG